jgi:hypothetical protein
MSAPDCKRAALALAEANPDPKEKIHECLMP